MDDLRHTPLFDQHAALQARRAGFAGYDIPIFYRGIYDETAAVRTACGMFDVSHMGRLEFPAEAEPFLSRLLTCRVSDIRPALGRYGLVLNESGGILDDVILYRKVSGDFLLVVNASNRDKILRWIEARGGRARDRSDATVMIAVQGPKAESILSAVVRPPATGSPYSTVAAIPYFGGADMEWTGLGPVWISRTGYTGEDGFELVAPNAQAEKMWQWLLKAGSVAPCGLGARDVLRVEAGYSLYGSDMDETVSPFECGLKFAVSPAGGYWGAEALKTRAPRRRLTGLDAGTDPSALIRHGHVIVLDGREVGQVTSGVFSKTLGRSIGFGSVDVAVPPDAALAVKGRGKEIPVRQVSRRFVKGRVKGHPA